jgi:hypothetical protein
MSALRQNQTSRHVRVMSALPPTADIRRCRWDVRKVPLRDIETYGWGPRLRTLGGRTSAGEARGLWTSSK